MQDNVLGDNLKETNVFKDYAANFKKSSISKSLQKEWFAKSCYYLEGLKESSKEYKKQFALFLSSDDYKQLEETEYRRQFVAFAKGVEEKKLNVFIQTENNVVALLQSPPEKVDNKSNKAEVIKFLGYDWSNRKGDEGIKYLTSHVQEAEGSDDDDDKDNEIVQAINSIKYIETPLYNPGNDNDVTKYSYALRKHITDACKKYSYGIKENDCDKSFLGDTNGLLQYARLVDLIDFSKTAFNLSIRTFVGKDVEKVSYKKGIEIKMLGQVADVRIGGTPSRNNSAFFGGDNLWVSIAEMNGTTIYNTKEKLSNEGVRASNVKLIPKGTTLLSFKLSIGKTAIAGADLYTNEAIAGLIPLDDTVSNEYLFQLFSSNMISLGNVDYKAFGKSLNSTYLKQVIIPLPPKVIQQKIVAECLKIETELYEAKDRISGLQEEIKNIMSIVKGKRTKLGDIYKISSGGTPSRKNSSYWINGDIPWVTTTEVTNDIITSTNECITKSGLENSSAKMYPKESLIIAMYGQGSTRGRTAKLGIEACTNQACAVLYEKKVEVETDFVWFYMQSQYENLRSISHGSVRPNLNANDITNYEIQLPPLAEQKTIVSKIQAIEGEIASLKAICEGAAARKKAVLHRELIEDEKQERSIETVESETDKEETKLVILPEYREGCIPLFTLRAACSDFDGERLPEEEGWVDASGNGFTPNPKRYFAIHAKGNSMYPDIKDGDICVFEWYNQTGGTREGDIVLAECDGIDDECTIKKYHSVKKYYEDGRWEHEKIELIPLNDEFDTIVLNADSHYRIIGVFKCVLQG
jgi:restriction endonuclease S subunit